MAITRITPTGTALTLGDPMPKLTDYEVAAVLVADRIVEITMPDAINRHEPVGAISYGQLKDAVAKMLAEGSIQATVQYA